MTWKDRVGRAWRRARAGLSAFSQATNLRVDIRNLEGRRDHALRAIGERACRLHAEGRGSAELAELCEDVRATEARIGALRESLERIRAQPSAEAPAG